MEKNLKVAIVHDWLTHRIGGGERVLKEIADLYPKAPIYVLAYDEKTAGKIFSEKRVRTSFLQKFPKFIKKRQKLLLPFAKRAIESFDLSEYDIVISSDAMFAKGVKTSPKTLHICYCNTPTRFLWDWHDKYLKEQNLNFITKFFVIKYLKHLKKWDLKASKRPDYIIANSKNVQRRIRKYYNRESNVIYPPVNISRFKEKPSEDFYLSVGILAPYKKIDLLVEAFNDFKEKLVIIGDGLDKERLTSLANENIEFKGFLKDKEIADYYSRCKAFLFPGEEDFGIAPVEAMASGKPVLAFRKGGLIESIVEGKTGDFFDKPTSESLLKELKKFKSEKFIPKDCIDRANNFSDKIFSENIKKYITDKWEEFRK